MELDFDGPLADRMYPILACLVVPRPIVLVTTISPNGKVNAAPFSFFNVLGAERSSVRQAFCSAVFSGPSHIAGSVSFFCGCRHLSVTRP
jgi:hypothetical protein